MLSQGVTLQLFISIFVAFRPIKVFGHIRKTLFFGYILFGKKRIGHLRFGHSKYHTNADHFYRHRTVLPKEPATKIRNLELNTMYIFLLNIPVLYIYIKSGVCINGRNSKISDRTGISYFCLTRVYVWYTFGSMKFISGNCKNLLKTKIEKKTQLKFTLDLKKYTHNEKFSNFPLQKFSNKRRQTAWTEMETTILLDNEIFVHPLFVPL